MPVDPRHDLELMALMDGFIDADVEGEKVEYLDSLSEKQREKLMAFLVQEVAIEIAGGRQ